ncbi:MAG: DNA polymerase III subunit alpha [Sphingomicrobium sp.]
MTAPYIPLRNLSCFTMLEGAMEPKTIAERAAKLGFPAIALADRNGLYAAMPFSDACFAKGVQPIVGAMLAVARPAEIGGGGLDWLVLLAKDEAGYANLCKLVSQAHLDRPLAEEPHVAMSALAGASDGLIALTAGSEGAPARLIADGQNAKARLYFDRLQTLFPDRLYIELSRRGDAVEEAAESTLVELAYERGLPLVATNPAAYTDPSFHAAHDAMLCIAHSAYLESADRVTSSPDAWLKDGAAMNVLFADLPEAIANSSVIAQRCAIAAPQRPPILPRLSDDEDETLRRDAHAGLAERMRGRADELKQYRERLDFELEVITGMGFAGYFLIVADFIKWAKGEGIPVGPGRGSGAGSVTAWALTITDLDPIALNLLFERFLNPERVSMPDFDIDFCETHRDEVIAYVQGKYGRDRVAQIITFGRLKARAVLKDTARVLQMSYGQVDRLAKLIPSHPTDPWDLKRALNGVTELAAEYRDDADVRRLFDLAMKLEGLPRHASTHAAGVVIGDRRLDELVPLYRDPRSDMPVTQFDMKYVEAAGLVKFDFLGLKTLSVLKQAQQMLAGQGVNVDLDALPWDDEQVYELLQRGDTVGVFQLESEGMRRTLSAVRPTAFGDIIALVALYRPGPMDNIGMFGDRKNGRVALATPHPLLEELLRETYGIFVYQEQVMEAAKVLAGFTLGEADLLRRAMGKKIQSEMDAQRAGFVAGCERVNGIPPPKANELFDLIDKFAGYGFNKSHAAGYALIAYQTAWLKTHHRAEFYAASMSFDMTQTDKLALFVEDMHRGGVDCLPPDINASRADFAVEGEAVRYALGALKGVGEKAMEALVAEREAHGPYPTLEDFAARIDPRLLNKRQIESLVGAGAFDSLVDDRPALYAAAETLLAHAVSAADERTSGQAALFGGEANAGVAPIRLPRDASWTLAQRMAAEHDAFGFYFSAHPVDSQKHLLAAHGVKTFAELASIPVSAEGRAGAMMAGLVEEARWRTSARGRRYMMATLSDSSGQYFVTAFDDEPCAALEAAMKSGGCGLITVELDRRPGDDVPRVTVKRFQPFDALAKRTRLEMIVRVPDTDTDTVHRIARELTGARGGTGAIRFIVGLATGAEATILLGRDYLLDAELAARIERITGEGSVDLAVQQPPKLALVG